MKITKKLAKHIELFDDETPTGGKAFCDEMLDEFMESVEIPFGTSLKKVNEGLVECGIEPITKGQIKLAEMASKMGVNVAH